MAVEFPYKTTLNDISSQVHVMILVDCKLYSSKAAFLISDHGNVLFVSLVAPCD